MKTTAFEHPLASGLCALLRDVEPNQPEERYINTCPEAWFISVGTGQDGSSPSSCFVLV